MRKDLICGLMALALAAVYLIETSKIQVSALGDTVGSGGFPFILGWLLAGTAALLLVQAALGAKVVAAARPDADDMAVVDVPPRVMFKRAAGLALIAAAFIALLDLLGYILSIALMLGAVMIYQGLALSGRTVLVSAGGALLLFALFGLLLGIPLPAGVLASLFG